MAFGTWLAALFGPLYTKGGVPLPQTYVTDFEGDGVDVAYDAAKQRTIVTIPGVTATALPLILLGAPATASGFPAPGPNATRLVQISTDFPGATSAILRATIFATPGTGAPSNWATGTVYSAGDIRTANGTRWVCTVGGTSAISGSGPAIEGPAVTDGTVVWRSAQATLSIVIITASGIITAGPLAVGYQLGAAATGPGLATLEVSLDLSADLIPLAGQTIAIEVGVGGDPADNGGSRYTAGTCSYAAVVFS